MNESKKTSTSVCGLEIASNSVKFGIGSVIDDKPILYYYDEENIRGAIKDGIICDEEKVKTAISNILKRTDDNLKLKTNIDTISLLLPSFGLTIYQTIKQNPIISPASLVDSMDVTNVMSYIEREIVPDGTKIIDIIPDYYELDDHKRYWNPPIGEKSKSIIVCAKIHVLPNELYKNYRLPVEETNIKLERTIVSSLSTTSLLSTDASLPHDYLLVDIGAHFTNVSMVGAKTLYATSVISKGGDDLTEAIASAFNLNFMDAEKLKIDYGYDDRNEKYIQPIYETKNDSQENISIYQMKFNEVISNFFLETFDVYLENAINKLFEKKQTSENKNVLPTLPIIFVGGGSQLNGIEKLLKPVIKEHSAIFYRPKVIGARDGKYCAMLGLFVDQNNNRNRVDDFYKPSIALSRSNN